MWVWNEIKNRPLGDFLYNIWISRMANAVLSGDSRVEWVESSRVSFPSFLFQSRFIEGAGIVFFKEKTDTVFVSIIRSLITKSVTRMHAHTPINYNVLPTITLKVKSFLQCRQALDCDSSHYWDNINIYSIDKYVLFVRANNNI